MPGIQASIVQDPAESGGRRRELCGIDQGVREALAAFSGGLDGQLEAMLDGFFAALVDAPEDDRFRNAREKQREHWLLLFSGGFGGDYFESARRIVEGHVSLGFEPDRRADGYMRLLALLHGALSRDVGNAETGHGLDRARLLAALDRALMFDLNLMNAIHLDIAQAKRRQRIDQLVDQFEAVALGVVRSVTGDCGKMAELAKQAEAGMMESWAEAIPAAGRREWAGSGSEAMAAVEAAVADANLKIGEIGESAESLAGNAALMRDLVTAFVDRIRNIERRASDHVQMYEPCRLSVDGWQVGGIVTDRSNGGAGVHADGSELSVGATGRLHVVNLERDVEVEIANATSYRVGLRFKDPEAAQRAFAMAVAAAE